MLWTVSQKFTEARIMINLKFLSVNFDLVITWLGCLLGAPTE